MNHYIVNRKQALKRYLYPIERKKIVGHVWEKNKGTFKRCKCGFSLRKMKEESTIVYFNINNEIDLDNPELTCPYSPEEHLVMDIIE